MNPCNFTLNSFVQSTPATSMPSSSPIIQQHTKVLESASFQAQKEACKTDRSGDSRDACIQAVYDLIKEIHKNL